MTAIEDAITDAIEQNARHYPSDNDFQRVIRDVLGSVRPLLREHPDLAQPGILRRVVEPERQIIFRVPWQADDGEHRVNRGMRIEHNSALGPYKGGLRFRGGLRSGQLRFLAFEQTFKNALTGMPLGGGKGGADLDPRGLSDDEMMRFCQSFMTELARHIGPRTDVPAGDIGVGGREVGYMMGQYQRIMNRFDGTITGLTPDAGGIPLRAAATGYGAVYFAASMAETAGTPLEGARCVVSGAGSVALHAAARLLEMGADVIAVSDSRGAATGRLDRDSLSELQRVKERGGSVADWADDHDVDYEGDASVWHMSLDADYAFACAIENEIDGEAARQLVDRGYRAVIEGANLPCTDEAVNVLSDSDVVRAPGKAANAGGVGVSQLEMRMHASWEPTDADTVDRQLRAMMKQIYRDCRQAAEAWSSPDDLSAGADIVGFERVARAMCRKGLT